MDHGSVRWDTGAASVLEASPPECRYAPEAASAEQLRKMGHFGRMLT